MGASDEEQLKAMLQSLGVQSVDDGNKAADASTDTPSESPKEALSQATLDELLGTKPAETPNNHEADPTVAAGKRSGAGTNRDISVPTLVHILGLSTSAEVNLLEDKIDVVSSRISGLAAKVDRLFSQIEALREETSLERIDKQLADIKAYLRKSGLGIHDSKDDYREKYSKPSPTILTSIPSIEEKQEAKDVTQAEGGQAGPAMSPEDEAASKAPRFESDLDFQQFEKERVRQKMLNPKQ